MVDTSMYVVANPCTYTLNTHTHTHCVCMQQFKKNACAYSLSFLDTSNLEAVFYISGIAVHSEVPTCLPQVLTRKSEIESLLTQSLETGVTMEILYRVTTIRTNLGLESETHKKIILHENFEW